MSDSAALQHARLPCPSLSTRVCSNSCPFSQWCHPTISSSVVPFSSRLQSFPAARSFPVSQLFASGGQSIGASGSTSVLPMNIQDWFPLGLTGLISLLSKRLARIFSSTSSKASILWLSAFFTVQLSHPYIHNYWKKNIVLTRWAFVSEVISLLFNAFYVCHSFSFNEQLSFNFMTAVIAHGDFGAEQIKFDTFFIFSPSILMKWWY